MIYVHTSEPQESLIGPFATEDEAKDFIDANCGGDDSDCTIVDTNEQIAPADFIKHRTPPGHPGSDADIT